VKQFLILVLVLDVLVFATAFGFSQQLTPSFLAVAAVNILISIGNLMRV
jgi:hypothetical protein